MSNLYAPVSSLDRLNLENGPLHDSSFGFFVTDESGLIRYLNEEAARILGFKNVNEAMEYSLHDFEMNTNCGLSDVFENILAGENFKKTEHRCTNRLGHYAVLNIALGPFREDGGGISGVMGTIWDVTESYQRKVKLEEADYVMSVISQVSEALASAAELNDVLRIILTGVTANQGLGFNRAFLLLINEEKNILEGKIAIGPNSSEEAHEIWSNLAGQHRTLLELLDDYKETEKNFGFSASSGIKDWEIDLNKPNFFAEVLESGSGIIVNESVETASESSNIFDYLQTESMAIVPIISKGRKLGIIAADNKITGKKITKTRLDLLQIFANNSAVAIEHSRLYDKVLERAKELEEINCQLASTQEQIIRAEKMSVIGELTSSIAHELRNPLMVIGGFANLMISSGDAGDNAEYLNIILSETQRSESVLHQVLDFSRASRTSSREIKFNALVKEAYDYFQTKTKFRQKGIYLNLSEESFKVWGNPDQLLHVLLQFIHLTAEGTTDECQAKITTHGACNKAECKKVRLTIEFTGSRQARDNAKKIYDKIFGSSDGTPRMSLIVAGETIKYHGGNYGVENLTNKGPILFIELPAMRVPEND